MKDWFHVIKDLLQALAVAPAPAPKADPLTRPELKCALAAKDVKIENDDESA